MKIAFPLADGWFKSRRRSLRAIWLNRVAFLCGISSAYFVVLMLPTMGTMATYSYLKYASYGVLTLVIPVTALLSVQSFVDLVRQLRLRVINVEEAVSVIAGTFWTILGITYLCYKFLYTQ